MARVIGPPLFLGVNLPDLGPDDFVVEFERLVDIVDVKKDARHLGRHGSLRGRRP